MIFNNFAVGDPMIIRSSEPTPDDFDVFNDENIVSSGGRYESGKFLSLKKGWQRTMPVVQEVGINNPNEIDHWRNHSIKANAIWK